jgi:hypothetical protein
VAERERERYMYGICCAGGAGEVLVELQRCWWWATRLHNNGERDGMRMRSVTSRDEARIIYTTSSGCAVDRRGGAAAGAWWGIWEDFNVTSHFLCVPYTTLRRMWDPCVQQYGGRHLIKDGN